MATRPWIDWTDGRALGDEQARAGGSHLSAPPVGPIQRRGRLTSLPHPLSEQVFSPYRRPMVKVDNGLIRQLVSWPSPRLARRVQRGAMSASPQAASGSRSGLDVLVVDDDEAVRSTSAVLLRSSGYTVAVASDGDVALRLLERQSVGVVLLDLQMPRRSGLSVLEEIDAPQAVVIVSAHSLDEATRARVGAKVVTYLEKPVPPERLLRTVASTLGRSRVSGN
jgi:CheY-like chemotaxis protein